MVEEAKAFCPGCGNAFVEEKERTTKTDFDLSANTIRLGDTMYNQMLSDMGLSISKQPNRDEPRTESSAPVASETIAVAPVPTSIVQPSPPKPSILKWVLIGIAAFVLLLALLVVLAAVVIILYSR